MLKADADQMCESSVAKHKCQHKRKHHPKTRWVTWRKLDYESRAAKVVRTKLFARTSNSLREIRDASIGFQFLVVAACQGLLQESQAAKQLHCTYASCLGVQAVWQHVSCQEGGDDTCKANLPLFAPQQRVEHQVVQKLASAQNPCFSQAQEQVLCLRPGVGTQEL